MHDGVILSNLYFVNWRVQFLTVPFKPLNDQGFILIYLQKLFVIFYNFI